MIKEKEKPWKIQATDGTSIGVCYCHGSYFFKFDIYGNFKTHNGDEKWKLIKCVYNENKKCNASCHLMEIGDDTCNCDETLGYHESCGFTYYYSHAFSVKLCNGRKFGMIDQDSTILWLGCNHNEVVSNFVKSHELENNPKVKSFCKKHKIDII